MSSDHFFLQHLLCVFKIKTKTLEEQGFSMGPLWQNISLWVFPRSRKRVAVPRVPVSTQNDTPMATLSRGTPFYEAQEKPRWKIIRKVKTLSCFVLFSHLWCKPRVTFLLLTTSKWKHVRESKGKIRHPKVERERLDSEQGAVFIKTAKPGKWNIVIMCCLQYNLVLISNIPQRLWLCARSCIQEVH